MNTLSVVILGLVWFYLAYRYYGNFIKRHLARKPASNITPAHKYKNFIDYMPGKKALLWGNHFAAIAGAGPIIGPILAVSYFGWGYTTLWIALGSVFIGAVHDYMSLIISNRNEGKGIAYIAGKYMGNSIQIAFSILLWLLLLLIVAVFMVSVAEALINVPQLVIPTFGLVFIATFVGLCLKAGMNDYLVAIVGIFLAYFLIWVGYIYPLALPATLSKNFIFIFWIVILTLYCFWASISPIWLLLRPRDFISSVKLVVGMLLGFIGIFLIHPHINAPFHVGGFYSGYKPIWPLLFIIVACGAISGFHAIVASGTTTKQLNKEADAKGIAFGGMILEGVLALLVVMVVSGGLYWGNAPIGTPAGNVDLYFANALSKNWIIAFGKGFGNIVGQLHIPYLTATLAALVGAVMVKSFILTTLDSGTRLARLICQEQFSKFLPIFKIRWMSSLIFLIPAFLLAITKSYITIWTTFGAANQLVASVTLLLISIWLVEKKRPTLYTFLPAIFMLCTTIASLLWESFNFHTGFFLGEKTEPAVGIIAMLLLVLVIYIIFVAGKKYMNLLRK